METRGRLSMNTTLRDARIFDDDSWDETTAGLIKPGDIKMECELKEELFDEETNFPLNNLSFDNFNIKKEDLEELTSPMKVESQEDSNSRKSFKSTKSFKKSMYKKRDSPYKSSTSKGASSSSPVTKLNFDTDTKLSVKSPKSKKEYESDPLTLSRRQKQIDYGKNTVGYDEYCKVVPKFQRKSGDPQTPDKYLKYSRRGWDGLIKQWRLKLHLYDPSD